MQKSLDRKLAAIHADPSGCREFIIADAKDADMAFGIGAAGKSPEAHSGEVRFRTLAEYREQIRQIVRQGKIDIMLMSASTNDVLTNRERLFDGSHITPAARANDTTDVWVLRGNRYVQEPSRPFRSATLDHIQCGHVDCDDAERTRGTNLGLYSITFNNRLDLDRQALEEYSRFREEAEAKGFRHFFEVFDPNAPAGLATDDVPRFINDAIARTLAGVAYAGRPIFLKVVYHGPKAMEELVAYDPHLVVGILGGGAGTTYDAFKLIAEAQKYGAKVALYGRKINNAENQLAFVEFLRLITDRLISPEEAVRAYHGVLQKLNVRPQRKLDDDLTLQTAVMSYGGGSSASVPAGVPTAAADAHHDCPCKTNPLTPGEPKPAGCGCHDASPPQPSGSVQPAQAVPLANARGSEDHRNGDRRGADEPDFAKMSAAEKLAYNQRKRDLLFGKY